MPELLGVCSCDGVRRAAVVTLDCGEQPVEPVFCTLAGADVTVGDGVAEVADAISEGDADAALVGGAAGDNVHGQRRDMEDVRQPQPERAVVFVHLQQDVDRSLVRARQFTLVAEGDVLLVAFLERREHVLVTAHVVARPAVHQEWRDIRRGGGAGRGDGSSALVRVVVAVVVLDALQYSETRLNHVITRALAVVSVVDSRRVGNGLLIIGDLRSGHRETRLAVQSGRCLATTTATASTAAASSRATAAAAAASEDTRMCVEVHRARGVVASRGGSRGETCARRASLSALVGLVEKARRDGFPRCLALVHRSDRGDRRLVVRHACQGREQSAHLEQLIEIMPRSRELGEDQFEVGDVVGQRGAGAELVCEHFVQQHQLCRRRLRRVPRAEPLPQSRWVPSVLLDRLQRPVAKSEDEDSNGLRAQLLVGSLLLFSSCLARRDRGPVDERQHALVVKDGPHAQLPQVKRVTRRIVELGDWGLVIAGVHGDGGVTRERQRYGARQRNGRGQGTGSMGAMLPLMGARCEKVCDFLSLGRSLSSDSVWSPL